MSSTFIFTLVVVASLAALVFMLMCSRRRRSGLSAAAPSDMLSLDARMQSGLKQEERALARMKPFWRREVVEAKVKSLFPSHEPAEVLRLLDEYGTGPYAPEPERVHLAILKLSGGDLEQLRRHLDTAKSD